MSTSHIYMPWLKLAAECPLVKSKVKRENTTLNNFYELYFLNLKKKKKRGKKNNKKPSVENVLLSEARQYLHTDKTMVIILDQ